MDVQLSMYEITGEYYLEDFPEISSGIQLNDDLTFLFFFTQDEMNRYSTGTWRLSDGKLILNSRPKPEKDFRLIESKTIPDKKITIKVVADNPQFAGYVLVTMKNKGGEQKALTDEDGTVQFPKKDFEEISLLFQLFPDRPSSFLIENKEHNYFKFELEPWIIEVFFEEDVFDFENNTISGTHALVPEQNLRFVKNENIEKEDLEQ